MVNKQLLEKVIAESGLKMDYLAEKLDISRQLLWMKINNRNDFRAREIKTLCRELGITRLSDKESIFFASEVSEKGNS